MAASWAVLGVSWGRWPSWEVFEASCWHYGHLLGRLTNALGPFGGLDPARRKNSPFLNYIGVVLASKMNGFGVSFCLRIPLVPHLSLSRTSLYSQVKDFEAFSSNVEHIAGPNKQQNKFSGRRSPKHRRRGPRQRKQRTLSVLSCFLSSLTSMRTLRSRLLLGNKQIW